MFHWFFLVFCHCGPFRHHIAYRISIFSTSARLFRMSDFTLWDHHFLSFSCQLWCEQKAQLVFTISAASGVVNFCDWHYIFPYRQYTILKKTNGSCTKMNKLVDYPVQNNFSKGKNYHTKLDFFRLLWNIDRHFRWKTKNGIGKWKSHEYVKFFKGKYVQ